MIEPFCKLSPDGVHYWVWTGQFLVGTPPKDELVCSHCGAVDYEPAIDPVKDCGKRMDYEWPQEGEGEE